MTALQYLQSDGNQYIDTGIIGKSGFKFEFKYRHTALTAAQLIIGSRPTKLNNNAFLFLTVNSTWRSDYYNSTTVFGSISINTDYTVIKDDNLTYINGVLSDTISATTFTTGQNIAIFSVNNGSNGIDTRGLQGKIYYCKIWDENSVLVCDFIPVLDESNIPCFYDTVSQSCFYNSGTGTFGYEIAANADTEVISPCSEVQVQSGQPQISADYNGYRIERKINSSEWALLSTANLNTSEYTDTDVQSGNTYYYRIKKIQNNVESEWSNEKEIVFSTSGNNAEVIIPLTASSILCLPPSVLATTNATILAEVSASQIQGKSPFINGGAKIVSIKGVVSSTALSPNVLGIINTSIISQSTQSAVVTKTPVITGIQNPSVIAPIALSSENAIKPVVVGSINIFTNVPVATIDITALQSTTFTNINVSVQATTATAEITSINPVVITQGSIALSAVKSVISIEALNPLLIGEKNVSTVVSLPSAQIDILSPVVNGIRNATVIFPLLNITAEALIPVMSTSQITSILAPTVTTSISGISPILSTTRNPVVSATRANINHVALKPSLLSIRNATIEAEIISVSVNANQPMVNVEETATIHATAIQTSADAISPILSAIRNVAVITTTANFVISTISPVVLGQINNIINLTTAQSQYNALVPVVNGITNAAILTPSAMLSVDAIKPEIIATRNAGIETESTTMIIVMISPIVKIIAKYIGYKMTLRDYSSFTNTSISNHDTKLNIKQNQSSVTDAQSQTNIRVMKHGTNVIDYDI